MSHDDTRRRVERTDDATGSADRLTSGRDRSTDARENRASDRGADDRSVGRRSVLVGTAGLVASAGVGTASALQTGSEVPSPAIEGPIEGGSRTGGPQTAAVHDVSAYGYTEEEYFFAGTAREDTYFGPFSRFADEADYRTRALVYRPTDPAAFNGHLLADWSNVSTGMDMPVTWMNAYDYLLREGYAVAAVSAQKVGVDDSPDGGEIVPAESEDLVSWDPQRYGDLHHPGDDYALDLFSQVIEGLRSGGANGTDPLSGLDVEYVLATGQSQSAGYMADMIEDVQPEYGQVDGYLPACSVASDIPDDHAPVLWLNTENEAEGLFGSFGGDPQEDSGRFRVWEVAGASHVNYWLSSWSRAARARDFDVDYAAWDETVAGNFGEREDGDYGDCQGNHFPARFAYSAALEALRDWVEGGSAPASAPRIERDSDGTVVTDDHGNAEGGVRLPPIDVPVATYDARSCDLEGETRRFDAAALADLYGSSDAYVAAFQDAVDDALASGHLLQAGADELVSRARTVEIQSTE